MEKPDAGLLRTAVAMLARRDFARAELARRLRRKAGESDGGDAGAALAVERVLDYVEAKGLLSEARFIDGFVRARSARFGPVRLRHELQQRGIDDERIEAALRKHQGDEYASACALWRQRFKAPPADVRERARQARFLAARGFSHDVIRRVLAHRPC